MALLSLLYKGLARLVHCSDGAPAPSIVCLIERSTLLAQGRYRGRPQEHTFFKSVLPPPFLPALRKRL